MEKRRITDEKYIEVLKISLTIGEAICRFCLKMRLQQTQKFTKIDDQIRKDYKILTSKDMGKSELDWLCAECEQALQSAISLVQTIKTSESIYGKYIEQSAPFTDEPKDSETFIKIEELHVDTDVEDYEVALKESEEWLEEGEADDNSKAANEIMITNKLSCSPIDIKAETEALRSPETETVDEEQNIDNITEDGGAVRKKRLIDYSKVEGYSETEVDGIMLFQCTTCNVQYPSRVALKKHFRTKHVRQDTREAECEICHQVMANAANLRRHKRMVHDSVVIKCKFCEKTGNQYYIDTHIRLNHAPKNYICDICDERFSFYSKIRAHILTVHKEGNAYKCRYCAESFIDEWQRIRHIRKTHAKEKSEEGKFLCPKCALRCGSKQGLLLHVNACGNARQTAKQTKERFSCPLCCHKFVQMKKLEKHMQEHANKNKPRPYVCHLCPATYGKNSHLKNHIMRAHTSLEEQKYKCKFCNKGFPFPKEKELHERYHTNEEFPNKCSECGKSFLTKTILGRHLKIHSETRRLQAKCYYCRFCKTRLIELQNLINHIVKYHPENWNQNVDYETWADADK